MTEKLENKMAEKIRIQRLKRLKNKMTEKIEK